MDQHDDVESIPWSELLETTDRSAGRLRVATLAVTLIGAVVLGAVVARGWWAPAAPTIIAPGDPVSVGPVTEAAPGDFVALPAEADLRAVPADAGVRAAVARAEWFVFDFFTADTEPVDGGDVRAALPERAEVPAMPQDGAEGISYVEWARAFKAEAVGDGTYLVSVVFRVLGAPPDGDFVRLPVRAVQIHVDVLGDGAAILDLPRPIPLPTGPEPTSWPDVAADPPAAVLDRVVAQVSSWGSEPRIVTAAETETGWRVVVTVTDDLGHRWPVSVLVDG